MTPIYQQNLAVIATRWPTMAEALNRASFDALEFTVIEHAAVTLQVNGIQLSSAFDPLEEAFHYRSLTSGNHYHLWGLGMGNVATLLMQDAQCASLTLYLYNLPLCKLVLSLLPLEWLSDPRLELKLITEDQDDAVKYTAMLSHPGCIILNGDKFISKRSHQWLFFRMENTLTIKHTHRLQVEGDEKFRLREQQNAPLLKKMSSIDRFLQYRIDHAICIGAGPSLAEHIDELKTLYQRADRPRFIAAATACKCLLEHGIKPDVVYVIDFDMPTEYIPFHIADNTILIAASRVPHEQLKLWHGEKYYLHLADETYDRVNQAFPTQFRPYVYGSVIHPMLHTTVYQGAKTIRLIGCDFGFPNEIIHAGMENRASDHNSSMDAWTQNGHGDLIKTSPTYRMFATGVENLISCALNTRFYNWSRMGAKILGTTYLDETEAFDHERALD